jgi:hypothetical protein
MGERVTTTNDKIKLWVLDALKACGGSARVPEIAQHIWDNHEAELRSSGDIFYTWQYAMRWAGQVLQKEGRLSKNREGRTWQLT